MGMDECRNCKSSQLRELGFAGAVAPFFLKRVFNMEVGTAGARNPWKRMICGLLKPVKPLFDRIYPPAAKVELQLCLTCLFVQVKHVLPEEWINALYTDYRSESYNTERIRYEPGYAAIARQIGLASEAEIRVAALTRWLDGKMEVRQDFSMLDFGGADGRFLPAVAAKKFVYEISDYQPAPGITRIHAEEELKQYDYVQVAHVLEHVMHPLDLVKKVTGYVSSGGYLYIEVPQEISDARLAALKQGAPATGFWVHEHINQYSCSAVAHLLEAAGLEVVAIEGKELDLGYARWVVVRAIGRKVNN
jgi:hypothetical protein